MKSHRATPRETSFRGLAVRALMLAFASLGVQCHTPNTSLDVGWICPGGNPHGSGSSPDLFSVWGANGSDVFAVGGDTDQSVTGNSLLRYDGSAWHEFQIEGTGRLGSYPPQTIHYRLFGDIWGSSSSDVFVVYDGGLDHSSSLLHFDGATTWVDLLYYEYRDALGFFHQPYYDDLSQVAPHAVWASSATDVFAVGGLGRIIHFDGARWSQLSTGVSERLNGVWGLSPFFVFAVGESGTTLFYDGPGHAWRQLINPSSTPSLHRVWGSSASDVFAVGNNATILHYDSAVSLGHLMDIGFLGIDPVSGRSKDLYGVWGSSANDVFAVGDNGTILHYDGSAWSAQTSGIEERRREYAPFSHPNNKLKGVWGTSAGDVFAVGANGTILHYDGSSWSIQSPRVHIVLTRSSAAPEERILSCDSPDDRGNSTLFGYRIANDEDWTVNGELMGYAGTVVARDSAVLRLTPGGHNSVTFTFHSVDRGSPGSVVLRWSINGSQPSDDLAALCSNWGADKVVATVNGGPPTSADCGVGSLAFTQLSGTAMLHARLVNAAGVDVAPPKDVTVQVVPGAAIDAHVDFQANFPCQSTGTTHSTANITASETWTAAAGPHHVPISLTIKNAAVLTVEPGATVCLGPFVALDFQEGARLVAGAAGGDQVMFTGDYFGASTPHGAWRWITLSGSPTGLHSVITNAIIEYAADAAVFTDYVHPVLIDATMIRRTGKVVLRAAGSQMTNSTVDATGVVLGGVGSGSIFFRSRVKNAPGPAAISIRDSTVNVELSNCEIIGSAQDGVSVEATATGNVTVSYCNLRNNLGLAINNASGTTVTADNDWWDPPGNGTPPRIGSPNGVSVNVTVTHVRSSGLILNY